MIEFCEKVAGRYKIEAHTVDESGNIVSSRVVADWFPNLITNQGLDRMGNNSDYLFACQVGQGNTPPAFTDTGLASYLVGTTTTTSRVSSPGVSPDWFNKQTTVFRFAVGDAAGNLTEVGIGWATSGSNLFSRALILDGLGNPTTITVLPSEILDVTYEFRTYPPLSDSAGVVNISGINYNFTVRAAEVDTIKGSNTSVGWGMVSGSFGTAAGGTSGNAGSGLSTAYTGAIGPITGIPAGSASGTSAIFPASAYVNGTYRRDYSMTFGVTELNVAGGILSQVFAYAWFTYQVQYTPAIPKDNTKTLVLNARHTWARH